jgi:hypothetical protein
MLQSWDEHRENHDALLRYLDERELSYQGDWPPPSRGVPQRAAATPPSNGGRNVFRWLRRLRSRTP